MLDEPTIITLEAFEAEVAPMLKPRFRSRFGAVTWREMDAAGPEHRWLVDGLITEGELSMMAGASQSGKSFLAIDMAMAVARGKKWFDREVEHGGVVYQAGEGALGVRRRRIPAYRTAHGVSVEEDLPFVLLPAKVNLWDGDAETDALIAEIQHWATTFSVPLRLVVIDTLAKAMTGGDEISGRDVGMVLERCERIRRATGAAVMLVHHLNAAGEKVRGHSSAEANLDSVLIVRMTESAAAKGEKGVPMKDADGRDIRECVVRKMKDGESGGKACRFVLRGVHLGTDARAEKPITSCVVAEPARGDEPETVGDSGVTLSAQAGVFLSSIMDALSEHGETPPPSLKVPRSVVRVVRWRAVKDTFAARSFEGDTEDEAKRAEALKKALQRHGTTLMKWSVIGRDRADGADWIWLTGRRVKGFRIGEPPKRPEPAPEPAPDDSGTTDYPDDLPF